MITREDLAETLYTAREKALAGRGARPISVAWPSLTADERAPWLAGSCRAQR
jgi:hypothetical protein